jgi:hypothetical protein
MVLLGDEVYRELHRRVEHLRDKDEEYHKDEGPKLEFAHPHQQARDQHHHGYDHVDAHVALSADRVDETPVCVIEAPRHALLTLHGLFTFLDHAPFP